MHQEYQVSTFSIRHIRMDPRGPGGGLVINFDTAGRSCPDKNKYELRVVLRKRTPLRSRKNLKGKGEKEEKCPIYTLSPFNDYL